MTRLVDDPRWMEHRDAYIAVSDGLDAPAGAHERYRHSLPPYLDYLAEITPPIARKGMMLALYEAENISLGLILLAFKATEEEGNFLRDRPPVQAEPVDEIERLQRLPYGVYLKTQHWQAVREAALKRAGYRCELDNATDRLEVHHRTYDRRGCERPADVVVLCHVCHGRHHGQLRAAS